MISFHKYFILTIILALGVSKLPAQNCNSGELGWSDIATIFTNNGCNGCHGTQSGFNLTSYQSFMLGGVKCGSEVTSGTTLVDIIAIDAYAGCSTPLTGQSMNDRVMGALDSLEILLIQRWVTAETPETCEDFCILNEYIYATLDDATYHFNVDNNLTANNSIINNSIINYEAGDTISLNKGFTVDVSSDFYAFIGKCDF